MAAVLSGAIAPHMLRSLIEIRLSIHMAQVPVLVRFDRAITTSTEYTAGSNHGHPLLAQALVRMTIHGHQDW